MHSLWDDPADKIVGKGRARRPGVRHNIAPCAVRDATTQLTWGTATTVEIVEGDITEQDVDAVVNAANSSLMGGGGVDGAIHRRGGHRILDECKEIRRLAWPDGLPSGKAVITGGGLLRARHVIHTVGPVWRGGRRGGAEALVGCYRSALEIMKERKLRSIAFPAISSGAYG
jgi:O-acetyl-ADP-ribose deacetylase